MHKLAAGALIVNALFPAVVAQAPLRLARVFGDHMVLQAELPARVFGFAGAGTSVAVAFGNQHHTAKTGDDGRFEVTLAPMAATSEGRELTVRAGDTVASIADVLVGEVWLCSGQSNMAWGVGSDTDWDLDEVAIDAPLVRYARAPQESRPEPLSDLPGDVRWVSLARATKDRARTSGVAFHLAVRLHTYLGVPVGIVDNSWGGSVAETWTSRATLETLPAAAELLAHWDARVAGWETEKAARIAAHAEAAADATATGKVAPNGPDLTPPQFDRNHPAGCYHASIVPLAKLALRGAVFFQGENNSIGQWEVYAASFPAMVTDWRRAFGRPDLPFGIVSLSGFGPAQRDREPEQEVVPGTFYYAAIRDVHFRAARALPHTGLIATFDLGDTDNIHPHRKRMVGERAARWALAQVYGKPVAHTGPIYDKMERNGARVRLFFALDPLAKVDGPWFESCPITREGAYRGFVIAGDDQHWHPAQVRRLDKERCLEVWSDLVPEPTAVRYGWANRPDANVIGIRHLPAHPFRTDDWPLYPQAPYVAAARKQWDAGRRQAEEKARAQVRARLRAEAERTLAPPDKR